MSKKRLSKMFCAVIAVAVIIILVCVYSGHIELWIAHICYSNEIVLNFGEKVCLPPFNVKDYSKIYVYSVVCGHEGIMCDLDEIKQEDYEVITNWFGSVHNDAIPSLCDYVPTYRFCLKKPNSEDLITVVDTSLVIYDISSGDGTTKQYVRPVSSVDRGLIKAIRHIFR